MKTHETLKERADEAGFIAILIIGFLLILPALPWGKYGGGITMVAGSVLGLLAYFVLFGERLRRRGQLKLAIVTVAVSAAIAVAMAFALPLIRGYGH